MNLDFLASIDLISRVHGLIRTIEFSTIRKRRKHHKRTNTPRGAASVEFVAPPDMAPADVEQMLRGYGVPVWDRAFHDDKLPDGRKLRRLTMKVPASQRKQAVWLMSCICPEVDGRACTPRPLPPRWADRQSDQPRAKRPRRTLRDRLEEWA